MVLFQKELKEKHGIHTKDDSGYCFRKIYGATKKHYDKILIRKYIENINNENYIHANNIRALSVILILNDDYEGCLFEFPRQDISLSLKKGQLIAFHQYWSIHTK